MILDAWGWCTGTTHRDGMGREVGGGFRMGNTCKKKKKEKKNLSWKSVGETSKTEGIK